MHEYAQDAMTKCTCKSNVTTPTTLTEFFTLCRNDTFARTLLYSEVPTYFTGNTSTRTFQHRKQGRAVQGHLNLDSTDALGRLYTVNPNNGECFYLRLLLINVRGPTSFQELKTVNGHMCATFREACQKLNILENDAHWDISLTDASNTAQPQQIRTLFSIILTTCFPANPKDLWEKYKNYMSEDILHHMRRINANPNIQFTSNIYNEALILIEDSCLTIANKSLTELGMIAPNRYGNDIFDRDIQRETHFDVIELQTFVRINLPKLVLEQRTAYDTIINAIFNKRCGLYFLDAPGDTEFVMAYKDYSAKSTSDVWQHFLRCENGQTAKCKLTDCQKILKIGGGSTKGLHTHLFSVRKIKIANPSTSTQDNPLELEVPPKKKAKNLTDYFLVFRCEEKSLETTLARLTARGSISV
ncbi:ATP-dependent DNA helicase [Trichonephila clavata]|uniref:ATP-dependent DNA helicase n=1 Tax=Trichonephila clavata TaxID=2740835 RepID=A0A8X6H1G2_TRICU|nr:ATP-dependent DNA helicase [Trichonephila clavata]